MRDTINEIRSKYSGGRFTWGRIGCEVNAPMFLDKDDPNYDDSASDATLEEVDMGPTTVNLVDVSQV